MVHSAHDENTLKDESSSLSVDLEGSGLSKFQKDKFKEFLIEFDGEFSDKRG